MSQVQERVTAATETPAALSFDMAIEIVVIPVADAEHAKHFYAALGWRLDLDFRKGDDYRVIQFTPPGSGCSVMFGKNITAAAPGSAQDHYLVVADLKRAREELLRRGVEVSEPFHDTGGVFHHADGKDVVRGFNPTRQSYATFASFKDPDGNGWLLQEITARLSADLQLGDPRFTSQVLQAIHGG